MKFRPILKEYIFGDERPFKSCHASTLVLLPNDEVLAAWFGGTKEGAPDVAIWCSKREKGKWTPPKKVADKEEIPHWNPVLFRAPGGGIYLFYKEGYKIEDWYTMVMISSDNGRTWSEPRELVKGDRGGRGPVKNKPIVLKDGTWLAPASIENEYWDAFVDISPDQGVTWKKSNFVPIEYSSLKGECIYKESKYTNQAVITSGKGIIQPTLWESEPGKVHMLLRSTEGRIYRSDSEDGGRTWSMAYPIDLPNNNSGIDLTRLDSGILVLAYNPVGVNKGPRTPLVLSFSRDNGMTWEGEFVLEDGEGEYSYPAIVSRENEIFLTYTWRRERIAFWRIALV